MQSMTGYGKAEYAENGITLTVEIKTVNNRFLDLIPKYPRAFVSGRYDKKGSSVENQKRQSGTFRNLFGYEFGFEKARYKRGFVRSVRSSG